MTTTTPSIQLISGGRPWPAAGRWRVDPAQSHASFAARVAGHTVRGRLPLTGRVLITEPIEDSTAWLAARTSAVSTGSPVLDRLLAGPGFLNAAAFPEITFRSDLLAWVPAGWRVVGRHRRQLGHRLKVGHRPADPRTWPAHRDDLLVLPPTGHVSSRASSFVRPSRWCVSLLRQRNARLVVGRRTAARGRVMHVAPCWPCPAEPASSPMRVSS